MQALRKDAKSRRALVSCARLFHQVGASTEKALALIEANKKRSDLHKYLYMCIYMYRCKFGNNDYYASHHNSEEDCDQVIHEGLVCCPSAQRGWATSDPSSAFL